MTCNLSVYKFFLKSLKILFIFLLTGLSSVSYSVPVVTKSIRISSGGFGGYGLGGHGLGGHGLGGLSRGHGGW